MEVLVVGGGAAGMACAIAAAERGFCVTIAEKMDRVGKKLLATGNGRCNLMNTGAWRYPCGSDFAQSILNQCGAGEQRLFWQQLGLRLREEDGGRVYPASGQAATVLDTLRVALALRGVNIRTGCPVEDIRPARRGFTVLLGGQQMHADRIVIACGGMAQPKLGSDGSALRLLKNLGHTLRPCTPALTALNCDMKPLAGLSGIRVKAEVSVLQSGVCAHREYGEVLFTDYGLSGVCVMNSAAYASLPGSEISLNLLPALGLSSIEDAIVELHRRHEAWRILPMEQLLTGLCAARLSSALCKAAGVNWKERSISSLTAKETQRLACTIADFRVPVKALRGFEQAQVTRGGADCAEFDPCTLQSRLVPGLYAVGEALDVDGECGGFNLMFAFGSGLVAGRKMEESIG